MGRRFADWLEALESRRMLSAVHPQAVALNGPLEASAKPVVAALSSSSGTISGTVFDDINNDGIQDFYEPNLANQHVWLDLNHDGKYEPNEPAATTDATGAFTFTGVADGTYVVRYYTPPGFHQTAPATTAAETVTVTGGVASGSITFGVSSGTLAQISGTVFNDTNTDGIQDGESGIAGQHLWIDLNHDGLWEPNEPTATTGNDGTYSFNGLAPGTYSVRLYVPPGFRQTGPASNAPRTIDVGAAPATLQSFGAAVDGLVFPPDPSNNLVKHNGRIIPNLNIVDLYVDSPTWQTSDITQIDRALPSALADVRLNSVVQQYFQTPVSTSLLATIKLGNVLTSSVSQQDVETLVTNIYNAQLSSFPAANTLFNFFLPRGDILSAPGADSTTGLGGFHGSVHIGGNTVLYAVSVFSQGTNGIDAFGVPWENIAATMYHEVNETRTDPDVEDATSNSNVLGWVSAGGEEVGDQPVFDVIFNGNDLHSVFTMVPLSNNTTMVPIQLLWSNALDGPGNPTLT